MDPYFTEFLLSPYLLGLLGLCIGSFLNVVIHRVPLMMEREWWSDISQQLGDAAAWKRVFGTSDAARPMLAQAGRTVDVALSSLAPLSLAKPRSRCPSCGHVLAWHENIPIAGWLLLKGKCSACKAPISARYPLVEAMTGALFAACGVKFGAQLGTLAWCAAVALLVAMAFIDLDTQLLPDSFTYALAGVGLLSAGFGWTGVTLESAAWGILAGYLSLWSVTHLYKLVRGVEGMGQGDFKLLAGLGALMGWQVLPSIILLSSMVGALVGVGLIVFRGHGRNVPMPFGPYLAGGGIAAMFFGQQLSRALWPAF